MHGARSGQVIAKIEREALAVKTRDAAVDFATPRQIDPAEGLIEEYWRSAGLVSYYERKAQELATLPDGSLVFGVVEEVTEHERVQGEDSTVEALQQLGLADDKGQVETKRKTTKRSAPNVWLQLYKEERTHFAKLGVEIARLGLEARRDEYIRLHMVAFVTVLDAIDLTPDQKTRAAAALRAIEGTSVR